YFQSVIEFTVNDLSLLQIVKAGKLALFYKGKLSRGTCKGHKLTTCKIFKEVTLKTVENEIAIMKKLGHHHNILQLLDWNTTREPYVFLMEFVSQGTLKTFLLRYKEPLSSSKDSQHLLMVAAYHIALAWNTYVVHGDLALRNILVGRFPQECKITEFGLAKNFSRMKSRRSSHKRQNMDQVPLRWYPPEYFKHNYYSFKGDIWAFGILLWELHTYGCLPYDHLHTSEDVVFHVCSGYRLKNPENCKPEMLSKKYRFFIGMD
uniref:Protein kinase domain-containing protein n=1 Tax=Erpetoichthys calabaricus TaxID=27687 RepID=A0A8C4X7P9_ERPCA